MAINYKWNVKTVDVQNIDGNADTVFNVHWRLTGTDENKKIKDFKGEDTSVSATLYGTQILDTSDLANFIPFADLTEKDIEGWVKTALGNNQIKIKKDSIKNSILELSNPKYQTKTIGE